MILLFDFKARAIPRSKRRSICLMELTPRSVSGGLQMAIEPQKTINNGTRTRVGKRNSEQKYVSYVGSLFG